MGLARRLSLSLGVAVALVSSITVASVAAAGGFGSSAGQFTFTDTSAFASYFNPADQSSTNVSVDRSLYLTRSRAGGPATTQTMTVLSVSIYVPDPTDPNLPPVFEADGCFVIPDSDFSVSSNVQSASLNATVDESNICPGFLVPVTGAEPAKGGGGGGGGFTFPLTVTATWTGTGATAVSDDQGTFRCLTFVSSTHSHSVSAFSATVTASIAGLSSFSGGTADGVFGAASINTYNDIVGGTGVIAPACGGKG
jgi:hypothetical protein